MDVSRGGIQDAFFEGYIVPWNVVTTLQWEPAKLIRLEGTHIALESSMIVQWGTRL